MSQDVTAVEGVEQGPNWQTLKGMEAPLRMWGSWTGDHFRVAGDRNQPTGEPVVLVRVWSERRGTARYGETQDGRTVYLGGAATRFWVQPGAGETPAAEEPEVVEEAPAPAPAEALVPTAPMTLKEARRRVADAHSQAEAFESLRDEAGEFHGYTFRVGRLNATRYGWITAGGKVCSRLVERYRGDARRVLTLAHRDEQGTPAADAQEAPAPAPAVEEVTEESVRYVAEFESVKAAPGHKEMRLTIRVRGEADPVEFYALTYMPGWTAEGMCRLFGWRPLADELEYTGTRTFGEVERTVSSLTPAGLDARLAFREEIVARFVVRLATGLADHFRAAFRLGRAYPIGWTYRVSYGAGARFGWVTAGGIMPERFTADTREAAEEQLRALDPTALPGHPDVSEYVSGLSTAELGRLFLALRGGDLSTLPEILTAGAPITGRQAVTLVGRTHGQADEFETLQSEGGRFLGWTFRCGRLRSSRYGWITARGTLAQALEPYRSTAADVLVYADRDDQEAAERTAVARSMTGRKLADNRCVHNHYTREDVEGDPVLACAMTTGGDTFGVFDQEEVYGTHRCAVEAANEAARGRDERLTECPGADPGVFWAKTCPKHADEVAGRCTECGQDTPDEDAPEARELTVGQAQEAARRVHPDATGFTSFHRPGSIDTAVGWTFRTGHGASARYGVVTRTGQVSGVGVYEYRTTAERAHLQTEEEATQRP